jgi:hypothetical protein
MKANPILCQPKKIIDHRIFKNSCIEKKKIAILNTFFSELFFQVMKREIPIIVNNVNQIGPKTHEGGLRGDFIIFSYQFGKDGVVKKEPIIPAV